MEFINLKNLFVLAHIFGAVLGAGGALYSDVLFIKSIKDKIVTKTELSFLKTVSIFVWIGLILLIVSGIGLYFTDPIKYTYSSKFLAKMSIVFIIFINGLFFHRVHIPFMNKRVRLHKRLFSREYPHENTAIIISGVISMVSWSFALVLGTLRFLPFTVSIILATYVFVIAIGIMSSVFVMKKNITIKTKYTLGSVSIVTGSISLGLLLI